MASSLHFGGKRRVGEKCRNKFLRRKLRREIVLEGPVFADCGKKNRKNKNWQSFVPHGSL